MEEGQRRLPVLYPGNRQSYTIAATDTGCTLSGAGQGSDTLTGVERLHFADVRELEFGDPAFA